jgi:hypothetical protein
MSRVFVRFLNLILAMSIAILPLQAQAGMIGTGEGAAQSRELLRGAIDRAEAAGRLQSWGLTRAAAHERIAALTDAEAAELAARAERAPAGADGAAVGLFVIIVFLIWHFWVGPAMNPETQKDPKKK